MFSIGSPDWLLWSSPKINMKVAEKIFSPFPFTESGRIFLFDFSLSEKAEKFSGVSHINLETVKKSYNDTGKQ